jgi:hypothetical protein
MRYIPYPLAYFARKLTVRAATEAMDRLYGESVGGQFEPDPNQPQN